MTGPPPSGSFSLFPNSRPPSRMRAQAVSPVSPVVHDTHGTPPDTVSAASPHVGEALTAEVRIERPAPVADVQRRADTNVQPDADEPPPFVRRGSARSRSSIAKMRLSMYDDTAPSLDPAPPPLPGPSSAAAYQMHAQLPHTPPQQHSRPPALRSIFPEYNPELSLERQEYYPTQTSPGRIPRGIISRPLYSPTQQEEREQRELEAQEELERSQQAQQVQQEWLDQTQQAQQAPSPVPHPTQPRLTLQTTLAAPAPPPAVYGTYPASVAGPVPSVAYAPSATYAPSVAPQVWPPRMGAAREAPSLPVPSTTDELRGFWKAANGWKAGSEGRVYCLHMTHDRDAPVYRLSSASQQPLYRMRVDPTSMAAYVTLMRHDPAQPFKPESGRHKSSAVADPAAAAAAAAAAAGSGRSSRASMDDASVLGGGGVVSEAEAAVALTHARHDASRHWQTALTTTLEEEARRHQPNDGLVALLYPQQAARMALAAGASEATVAAAERECARLVWDDDSARFFLVHPVLALPFCIGIERSATWSRTAYTLEHIESPQHLARLTRDGTGAGWLEIDTAVASKIDAAYLVDVAVAALLLVAHSDVQFAHVAAFAPPPAMDSVVGAAAGAANPRGSLVQAVGGVAGRSASRLSSLAPDGRSKSRLSTKAKGKKRGRMEELELDLESQNSIDLTGKAFEDGVPTRRGGRKTKSRRRKDDDEKLPGCLRLIAALFKCCFWCISIFVRAILAILGALFHCLTNEKL